MSFYLMFSSVKTLNDELEMKAKKGKEAFEKLSAKKGGKKKSPVTVDLANGSQDSDHEDHSVHSQNTHRFCKQTQPFNYADLGEPMEPNNKTIKKERKKAVTKTPPSSKKKPGKKVKKAKSPWVEPRDHASCHMC